MSDFISDSPVETFYPLRANEPGIIWLYSNVNLMNRPHSHKELELNCVTHGHATYLIEQRRYQIAEGSILWLFPAQSHMLVDRSPDFEMWLGIFPPDLISTACSSDRNRLLAELNPFGRFCKRLSSSQLASVTRLFADIVAAKSNDDRFRMGLGYALLAAWDAYLDADQAPKSNELHPSVERAVRFLRDEQEFCTMAQLSCYVGLSPSRLRKVFSDQVGVSLMDFRNQQRIDRFMRLYRRGGQVSMLTAALACGFGSYLQFYRVFKSITGSAPLEYYKSGSIRT
jgi:AraC-like DNA-binding protein